MIVWAHAQTHYMPCAISQQNTEDGVEGGRARQKKHIESDEEKSLKGITFPSYRLQQQQ